MPLSVDVVMPVYGGWEMTRRCLDRLSAQTIPCSIVLVDNGSPDGTPAHVRAEFPHVHVIELGTNLQFSAAANRGASHGTGDVILLLSNDTFCAPDFLERLLDAFADENVGSAAPLLFREGEPAVENVGIRIDRTLASFVRLPGADPAEVAGSAALLAGPGGGADAYRRSAFEQVGGFDEQLGFYFTDTELAIRLAVAGWTTAAALGATGVHLRSATTHHRSSFSRASGGWGRGYLLRRFGVLERAPVRTLVTEAIVVAADLVFSRDLVAVRSRIDGWRAARGLAKLDWPPDALIDDGITFAESLRLRWAAR